MVMCDETYNGWSNRETWCFMLHVQNDEYLASLFADTVRDERTDPAYAVQRDAEALLNWDAYEFETGSLMPAELVRMSQDVGSLWRVNWAECTAALLEGE